MKKHKKKRPSTLVSHFSLIEQGEAREIPGRINGLHKLSAYLLRDFLESNDYEYNTTDKVEMVTDIVANQDTKKYTRYSALPNIARLIVSCYDIRKNGGILPLSKRDVRQLEYVLKKALEDAVTRYDKNI